MVHLTAIDPGAEHIGVVAFNAELGSLEEPTLDRNMDLTPDQFYDWFEEDVRMGRAISNLDIVAYETFQLYPHAKHQAFNRFVTVEVIGVIKFLCKKYSVPLISVHPTERNLIRVTTKFTSPHTKAAYAVGVWALRFGAKQLSRQGVPA